MSQAGAVFSHLLHFYLQSQNKASVPRSSPPQVIEKARKDQYSALLIAGWGVMGSC